MSEVKVKGSKCGGELVEDFDGRFYNFNAYSVTRDGGNLIDWSLAWRHDL